MKYIEEKSHDVSFENIDITITVDARSTHEAVKKAVREIPAWESHKNTGAVQVTCPMHEGNYYIFEPETKWVNTGYSDERFFE